MATKQDRQKVLGEIYKKDKCIRASVVVAKATPSKSPIHDDFEWDDKVAAHQHRLDRARQIIRTTEIVSPTGERQKIIHIPPERLEGPTAVEQEKEGVYKPINVVRDDPSEYKRALEELQTQIRGLERTVRLLKRVADDEGRQLLPALLDSMRVAKSTVKLMLHEAA